MVAEKGDKYSLAKQKIAKWRKALSQKGGKSNYDKLQISYDLASKGDFKGAIQVSETILANYDKYSLAKQKIVRWKLLTKELKSF